MKKLGASDWTIGKLINIILIIVVLSLIVYGGVNRGFNPLLDNLKERWDSSIYFINSFRSSDLGQCYNSSVSMLGGGLALLKRLGIKEAKVDVCSAGVCSFSSESFAYRINRGKFEKFEGGEWKEFFNIIRNVSEVDLEWELYHKVGGILGTIEPPRGYPTYLDSKDSKKFVLYGDGIGVGGDILMTWQNNFWTMIKGDSLFFSAGWVNYNRNDDYAFNVFYEEVTKGKNDNVYWKVLDSDEKYDKENDKGTPVDAFIAGRLTSNELYAGLDKAETNFDDSDAWIRTDVTGSGSTAYGPVQITMGLVKGYLENSNMRWTDGEKEYLHKFIDQGCMFLLNGGGCIEKEFGVCIKGKIDDNQLDSSKCSDSYARMGIDENTEYNFNYDYKGMGDLYGDEDRIMYKQVAVKMINDIYAREGYDADKFLWEWRFGNKDTSSVSSYNMKGFKKYKTRFYEGAGKGDTKLDSDTELASLEGIFKNKKTEFLLETIPSAENVVKLKEFLMGKSVDFDGKRFFLSIDESSPFFVISMESSDAKYGLMYSPHAQLSSDFVFNHYVVSLDSFPFVFVKWNGKAWVEIGEEGVYKLPEKNFKEVFEASIINEFLRSKCK